MRSLREIRRETKKAYKRLKNWRKVGAEMGITGGMAYRIAVDGYEPKEARIRARLGLPAMVPAPACPVCGEVHVSRRCTKGAAKPQGLFEMSKKALLRALKEREEW